MTLVLSVTVHEYAHALAAFKLGDDYAAREGRLTLNPLAHIDPIGTLLIPAIAMVSPVAPFGWGRPVPTIPINYTRRFSMRAGEAIVSFAGPFANLVMGIVCSGLWVGLTELTVIDVRSPFDALLLMMARLNIVLFFFNLLPFPPLDGSKIVAWAFGYRVDKILDALQNLGMIGLYLMLTGAGSLISWVANLAFRAIIVGFRGMIG